MVIGEAGEIGQVALEVVTVVLKKEFVLVTIHLPQMEEPNAMEL